MYIIAISTIKYTQMYVSCLYYIERIKFSVIRLFIFFYSIFLRTVVYLLRNSNWNRVDQNFRKVFEII